MILLESIKLNNFLSHEDTKISFQENEKLLVDGKSGSGKSSITEALLFAFYGKGRSDNRSLVRKGSKGGASVSLKINDGESKYVITRSISSAGKNGLVVTRSEGTAEQYKAIEKVGIKDIQEWIEKDLLGASYELFTNSIAYPQDNENSFVKASAGQRKDLLLEIVRAGNFSELYEKAKNALTINEKENAVKTFEIKALEEKVSKFTEIANTLEQHKKSKREINSKIETIEMVEKSNEEQLNTLSNLSTLEITSKKVQKMLIDSIEKDEKKIKEKKEEVYKYASFNLVDGLKSIEELDGLKLILKDKEKKLSDISIGQQLINSHLSNRPSVFDYSKDIEEINKRLIDLMKETGKCPSGDKCPFMKPVMGQIEYLSSQIEEKTNNSIIEEEAFKKWEESGRLLPMLEDINTVYQEVKDIKTRISELEVIKGEVEEYNAFNANLTEISAEIAMSELELDQLRKELTIATEELSRINGLIAKMDANEINRVISSLRVSKAELQKELSEATLGESLAINAQMERKQASIALVELHRGIVESTDQAESLSLLKEALSPRGVKAVVIDYLVPQLEERINSVLTQMSDFRIRLDTQENTVDGEGIKEGLFITVMNDRNDELPFDLYSGGEKVKITIAISEALASLMNQIGFRMMDENIVSLDKESTTSFVEILEKLQDKFPQLLLISHLQEVKEIFEKKITVVKINGISKINEK